MHIHKIVYIKTFKITPTCFDPKIIFRDLHRSSIKSQYGKHKPCFNPDSLIICVQNSVLTIVFWQSNLTWLVW